MKSSPPISPRLSLAKFSMPVAKWSKKTATFDFGRLLAAFDDPAVKNFIVAIDEARAEKGTTDHQRIWPDLVAAARRRREEQQRRLALATAQSDQDEAERMLASFYQKNRTKNLSEYERRKS